MVAQILPQQPADKLSTGEPVCLVYVREPEGQDFAAVPHSTLIPLGELSGRAGEVEPPPDALVVVYCHHGIRSLRGAAILEQAGVRPAVSLAGGIDAWSRLIDPSVPRY